MDFSKQKFSLPELEKQILEFWRKDKTFEKSLRKNKKKKFVFYEGPPTANGRPGLHHVLARSFKDVIPRYKTMRGYCVPRRAGWDTHGLPVEIEVEKKLGLKSKKEIEKYGIAAFNQKCRESVWEYKDDWEKLTERMGFWVDLKHPYVTYDPRYVESLWRIMQQFWEKKLLYKGHKVVPWCPRCGTALSSHELAQGYREIEDDSVYIKFKLKPGQRIGKNFITDDSTYILSWTTTPWTLPGNVALAVGENVDYQIYRAAGKKEIWIESAATYVMPPYGVAKGKPVEPLQGSVVKGKDLVGLGYEPLFKIDELKGINSYKIYPADFVTTTDGTGVVHTAVMYGEDDYRLGIEVGLLQYHTVTEEGKFISQVKGLEGKYVKSKETENEISEILKAGNNFLEKKKYVHEYPYCWRCGTPILYYARTSWFVRMSGLKSRLISNNKKINWIPSHVKTGRFGGWLKEAKDWNFSRERYWGTPLPVWECGSCEKKEVVGSFAELKGRSKAKNTFLFVRHGESDNIVDKICTSSDTEKYTPHLTKRGIKTVEHTAVKLDGWVDVIVSSPLARTVETAEIISKKTGARIIVRDDLVDLHQGDQEGKSAKEEAGRFKNRLEIFEKPLPQGESRNDLKRRMWKAFREIDSGYSGKRILIVCHGDPLWILKGVLEAKSNEEILRLPYPKPGVLYHIDTRPLPLDADGNLNPHRPYIDEIKLECGCGGEMTRIKELADVWFDSGAMPFAQVHWPFDQLRNSKSEIRNNSVPLEYPADFICEAMDQTRGWFYTLLAVSTAMDRGPSYRNVISLGLIHDKHGQKMSKSKGNVVDPWEMMNKYGADAVRWYFYAATPPGEAKNFDETEILKAVRRMHMILWNSLVFYNTYADKRGTRDARSNRRRPASLLDKWIISRLNETISRTTKGLETYDLRSAALSIESLVDDLSKWYIRRSRRRFSASAKGKTSLQVRKDFLEASATLRHVMSRIALMLAPFNPFLAEALWLDLGGEKSVHLSDWPSADAKLIDKKLQKAMFLVRETASAGLSKRIEAQIKVRQPLASLTLKKPVAKGRLQSEISEILKEEVNVKNIKFNPKQKEEIILDTTITPELKEEGALRELVRTIQDLRQEAGLKPKDKIVLYLELPDAIREIAGRNEKFLQNEVGARKINHQKIESSAAAREISIGTQKIWIGISA